MAVACSDGESVLDAGNDESSTPAGSEPPSPPDRPDGSDPVSGADGAPDTVGEGTAVDGPTDTGTAGSGSAPPDPGSTTTVAPLRDLPDCPVEALEPAASTDGPVEITFWHSMGNQLETALVSLVDDYHAGQELVRVVLQNQTSYESTIDKYVQGSPASRPDIVQIPEYVTQSFAESETFVPVESCIRAAAWDTSAVLPRALDTYAFQGVQWAMPFNVSAPVLYFNEIMFRTAGLDPADPPVSLEEVRSASQSLVDSGASTYGLVLDSGRDSGGGWFFEHWFGRAGEPYADNGNGRLAPATQVLFDSQLGVDLLTYLQDLITDGLAVSVGDNPGGQDTFLKMVDQSEPGAMTIATSAAMSSVFEALGAGIAPGVGPDDLGVGPMPGPGDQPAVQVGGAALWIPAGRSDETTAAAWHLLTYLLDAQTQSTWTAATGYVPVRSDAVDLDPIATTYADDPRYRVAYDQLLTSSDDPSSVVPALGPLREIRSETADAIAAVYAGADVEETLAEAARRANRLLDAYNAQN